MKKSIVTLVLVAAVGFAGTALGLQAGERGVATWNGKNYTVEIKKIDGERCYISWVDYGKTWDEWKPCKDIKVGAAANPVKVFIEYNVGDAVKVSWKGSWYPARILAVNKEKGTYRVHYDNYSNEWDEWVGPSRMKK